MFRGDVARWRRWWAVLGVAAVVLAPTIGAYGAERMVLGEYFTMIG